MQSLKDFQSACEMARFSQLAITFSKLTIETLEEDVEYVQR